MMPPSCCGIARFGGLPARGAQAGIGAVNDALRGEIDYWCRVISVMQTGARAEEALNEAFYRLTEAAAREGWTEDDLDYAGDQLYACYDAWVPPQNTVDTSQTADQTGLEDLLQYPQNTGITGSVPWYKNPWAVGGIAVAGVAGLGVVAWALWPRRF